jgi:hypothetical protein
MEILAITRPVTQAAAQIRHLKRMGIRAERRPDGSVLVMPEWVAKKDETGGRSRPQLKSDRRNGQTT